MAVLQAKAWLQSPAVVHGGGMVVVVLVVVVVELVEVPAAQPHKH